MVSLCFSEGLCINAGGLNRFWGWVEFKRSGGGRALSVGPITGVSWYRLFFYRNANLSQQHQSLGAFVRGAKGSGEMLGVEEMRFGFLLIVLSLSIYPSTFLSSRFSLYLNSVFTAHICLNQ